MDLLLSLAAKDTASAVFGQFSGAVLGTAKALGDMMKSAADAERVERQLHRVAGEMTGAFKQQAQAISNQLAVEDELVMSMQTVLLRFGTAPAAIDSTTRAILDYAAATGKDAQSATEALMRGVQGGSGSIKGLGVQFEATGDFATDLARATAEVNRKFGGAAQVDAATLTGSARAASVAMGELQESFGGLVNDFISKTGVVQSMTQMLRQLKEDIFTPPKDQAEQRAALLKEKAFIESALAKGINSSVPGSLTQEQVLKRLQDINAELEKIERSSAAPALGLSDKALPGFEGKVKEKGEKKSGDSEADEALDFKIGMTQTQTSFRDQMKEEDGYLLDQENKRKKEMEEYEKELNEHIARVAEAEQEALISQKKQHDEDFKEYAAASEKAQKEFVRQQEETFSKQANMWVNAGLDIGSAIIDGVVAAMEAGEEGGGGGAEIAKAVYGMVESVIGIIFSALGYGAVWQGFQGVTGAIETVGTDAAYGDTAHTGGWPKKRYHAGGFPGEVPAILQEGERVLSRSEVASMGGRNGVESRIRGGGQGGTVNVYALDSSSFQDYLGGKGGRGFFNAVRTGKGSLATVIGRI